MSNLKQLIRPNTQEKEQDLATRKQYIFHDDVNKQLDCKSHTESSGRRYYTIGDITLPSVTTVLSATKPKKDRDGLDRWKKSVGSEEADRVIREAAKRGNWLHNMVEWYIVDDDRFKVPKYSTNNYALWKQMYNMIQRIDNVRSVEGALYSQSLGMAGRVDCVADFDGKLSIIDFKTTSTEKREEWIHDYFLQETAYALMYSEMHDVKVQQIVTLMAKDGDMNGEGCVFIKKPVDYVKPLLKRIKQYKLLQG